MIRFEKEERKIGAFYDLDVWKEGHKLVLEIYCITKDFPRDEIFGLSSQMRRAGVSITSNIAEGFGRRSVAEKLQFYNISRGSLIELHNQLLVARDVGYINSDTFKSTENQVIKVHKILNAFITSTYRFSGR